MRFVSRPIWSTIVAVVALALLCASCASSDPEVDDGGNQSDIDAGDTGDRDATDGDDGDDSDTDADDGDTGDGGDGCDDCRDDEQCVAGICVDLCAEQQYQCGQWEAQGHEIDCGSCPAGDCDDDGQCPDICEIYHAQCGELTWNGSAHGCGSCSGIDRCVNHQCTAGEGYLDVVAGHAHSCGLRPNGEVRCWGRNEDGQLGDNDQPQGAPTSQRVHDLLTATQVSSQNHHTCAVRDDEHVYCWGRGQQGRLGDGTTDDAPTPRRATEVFATKVAAGGSHSCALLESSKVLCWGDNGQGQLATGAHADDPSFDHDKRRALVATGDELVDIVDISAGSGHNCALRQDNTLWCWGLNNSGQLGQGDNFDAPAFATAVPDLEDIHQVNAGSLHTCATGAEGQLWCWGRGQDGQIGDGQTSPRYSPTPVDLAAPVIDVATGQFHTCAATADGTVYCWGRNSDGQLGQGMTGDPIAEPTEVANLENIHSVTAGAAHTCAVDRDGQAYCWGRNGDGQLGTDLVDENASLPQAVQ